LRALLPAALVLVAMAALAVPSAAQVPKVRGSVPSTPRVPPAAQQPRARPANDTTPRAPGDTARRPAGDSARTRTFAPDTLYDALLKLPGYTPVQYQGDSATFRTADHALRLYGNSTVTREGSEIQAKDSLVYRERSRFVEAYGQPKATGEGEDITANVMFYDLETRRATARGASTKITEGATWIVHGDVTSEAAQRVYATDGVFTSDDRATPAYHFEAEKIMVIKNRILVGRPAVLYFRNVPVLALPFIVQDLEKGRRSGILVPQFSVNDIVRTSSRRSGEGTGRELSNVGYYWAINQYMGAQLAARWRSGSYRALAGGLEYKWRQRFLSGGATFENFWTTEAGGSRRFNFTTQDAWKPSENTDISVSGNYASDTGFERRRTIDPTRATQNLASTASLTHRFSWGNLSTTAERRQSLANDNVASTLPSFNLGLNPITLFQSADPDHAHFFNDATLSFNANGSRSTTQPGDALRTRNPGTSNTTLAASQSLTLHALSIGTSVNYGKAGNDALAAIDSADAAPGVSPLSLRALPGRDQATLQWSATTSYQIKLISSTTISPSLSISQNLVNVTDTASDTLVLRDPNRSRAFGRFVSAPMRANFGAAINTDLYGFFPGFGPYTAIRHHVHPTISYSYVPGFRSDTVQALAFGPEASRTQNQFTLGLEQTFEAKVRTPKVQHTDSAGADSARAAGQEQGPPPDARKVTMLAISTSSLLYSFVPQPRTAFDISGRRFQTPDITNTVRSDYLGGLNFTVAHSLFRDVLGTSGSSAIPASSRFRGIVGDSGRIVGHQFDPFLTSLSTTFSLGQNSALFRFLGLTRGPNDTGRSGERAATPDTVRQQPLNPLGSGGATANRQETGRGPWTMSVRYSLSRLRPAASDSLRRGISSGNQDLSGNMSFYPTANWGVNWTTSYSLTDGRFTQHSLNFTRNLYRWQANFDFFRTATGNTAFAFRVHLVDLPDLKFDYHEQNVGIDRPTTP
jgi:hypothetical protein